MLKTPTLFNPDEFAKLYVEKKQTKTPRQCRNGLAWVKAKTKVETINNDTLPLIEKYILCCRMNKEFKDDITYETMIGYTGRTMVILETLFGYRFNRSDNSINNILNQTDLREENMPKSLSIYYSSDPQLYKILLDMKNYIYQTNYSNNYKKDLTTNMTKSLVPLRDSFINDTISRDEILDFIQKREDNLNTEVISRNSCYNNKSSSYVVRHMVNSYNVYIRSGLFPNIKNCKEISPSEIKIKPKDIKHVERDYFTDDELDNISNAYTNDRERLVFSLFLTVGLRRGGVNNLKVKYLFDEDLIVLNNGSALEKGGKIRKFVIFPALKQSLEKYKESYPQLLQGPEYYIFPDHLKPSQSKACSLTTITKIFKDVCKRANVTGQQVHTHACRKTVVVNLMKDGNSIDNVAKFIGHENPITTAKHYWVTTPDDLVSSMNINWLVGNPTINSNDSNSVTTGPNIKQIQQIATCIAEGFKAQERLNHAISVMTRDQIELMESMWGMESKERVAINTKNMMIKIAEASTIMTDTMSIKTQDS